MQKPKILTLVGGISQNSLNKKLFRALEQTVGQDATLFTFDISKLPFFSQDLENDPPDQVNLFKEAVREADAIIFITPEYNHSVPGVLKNAIDWGTRPYPENLWEKLPVGIMGASIGNIGTFSAQTHLRQIVSYLNMHLMNQPEFYLNGSKAFNEQGKLTDEKTINFLDKFWHSFKTWIDEYEVANLAQKNLLKHEYASEKAGPGIH